jgi:hypothetical protein
MNDEIRRLVQQLADLEEELRDRLHEQETRVLYQLEGKKVLFQEQVREAHDKLRQALLPYLGQSSWRSYASAPVIYSLIVPFALLDLFVSAYQEICFRLYRIPRVKRSRYIVIDRHQLRYLNSLQRFNCVYCSYINGLIAFVREVASRTEQYWCPIKHARRVTGSHTRYSNFLDYGDGEDLEQKLEVLREQLRKKAA